VHFFHHRIGIWYDGRQKWAPGFLDTTLHFLVLLLTVLFIVLYKDFALCSEGHSQFRFPFQEVLFAANGGYIGIASHGFALHCVWSLGSAFLTWEEFCEPKVSGMGFAEMWMEWHHGNEQRWM
jgi:hypothetical protein